MKKLTMPDIDKELLSETPFADHVLRKQKTAEDIDNPEYKSRLEAFAKSLKGADVEFKYIDEKHWAIFFD